MQNRCFHTREGRKIINLTRGGGNPREQDYGIFLSSFFFFLFFTVYFRRRKCFSALFTVYTFAHESQRRRLLTFLEANEQHVSRLRCNFPAAAAATLALETCTHDDDATARLKCRKLYYLFKLNVLNVTFHLYVCVHQRRHNSDDGYPDGSFPTLLPLGGGVLTDYLHVLPSLLALLTGIVNAQMT